MTKVTASKQRVNTSVYYLESYDVLLWVSKSASSVSVLAKLPLFLVFTPASTDPSRAVFCVNKELVEMKLPCLQKQEA